MHVRLCVCVCVCQKAWESYNLSNLVPKTKCASHKCSEYLLTMCTEDCRYLTEVTNSNWNTYLLLLQDTLLVPELTLNLTTLFYRLHGGDNVQVKRYFVSFWNGVDLRYKLLKGPKIRISIAGIIISRVCTTSTKMIAQGANSYLSTNSTEYSSSLDGKEVAEFYVTWRFITVFTKAHTEMNPVHASPLYFFKIYFDITLTAMCKSSKRFLSFRFP